MKKEDEAKQDGTTNEDGTPHNRTKKIKEDEIG
jgi:hypothetical protein